MENVCLLVIFFAFQIVSAQEETSKLDEKIYDIKDVDVKPEYLGGIDVFYQFVVKKIKTPEQED